MPITHSHYCKHCDRTWSDKCLDTAYNYSSLHDCWQRKWYVKALAEALNDDTQQTAYPTQNPRARRKTKEKQLVRLPEPLIIVPGKPGIHHDDCLCKLCIRKFREEVRSKLR